MHVVQAKRQMHFTRNITIMNKEIISSCFNPLKPSTYVPHALTINTSQFCIYGFHMNLSTVIISLNSINMLIFIVEGCCVFSETQIEFLNVTQISFRFKKISKTINSEEINVPQHRE
jgi:hypothetical protein